MSDDAALERKADAQRKRRQREFLKKIGGFKTTLRKLLEDATAMEEIAASGQSHAGAVFIEVKAAYQARTGDEYVGNAAADTKALRGLITAHGVDEVRRRLGLYFTDPDPFLAENGFPMSLFRRRFASYSANSRKTSSKAAAEAQRGNRDLDKWLDGK